MEGWYNSNVLSSIGWTLEKVTPLLELAADYKKSIQQKIDISTKTRLSCLTLFYEPSTRTRLSFESAAHQHGVRVSSVANAAHESSAKEGRDAGGHGPDPLLVRRRRRDAPPRPRRGAAPLVDRNDPGDQRRRRRGRAPHAGAGRRVHHPRGVRQLQGPPGGAVRRPPEWPHHPLAAPAAGLLRVPDRRHLPRGARDPARDPEQDPARRGRGARGAGPAQGDPRDRRALHDPGAKERFHDIDVYERVKDSYRLTRADLENASDHLRIMHPLPRIDEVHTDVDADSRALYFTQSANGVPVRMALLTAVLGLQNRVHYGASQS